MNNTTDTDPGKAFWIEPWDYSVQNFFVAVIGLAMFLVLVAFLWKCCDWIEEKPNTNIPKQSFPVTPIYAHELEPGLVVLQSQDGEYFRILQEYDSKHLNNGRANPSAAACADPPIGETTIQYIPQYTRPHYQNQPTAPPSRPDTDHLIDVPIPASPPVPPPYSQY